MILRTRYESNDDIGVYSKLTNSYCLVASGASQNFYSVFEKELSIFIPVIHCSIGDSRVIGRVCAGNKHGLLVPHTTTEPELQHLRNSLPDAIMVQRISERLSALGNIIQCNDYVALVHPEISDETEMIVRDVLRVQTFRWSFSICPLVGSYCIFNNKGCLVYSKMKLAEMEELAALIQVPVVACTVNRGNLSIGSGLVCNDWIAFCGLTTTATELTILERVLKLNTQHILPINKEELENENINHIPISNNTTQDMQALRNTLIDELS